MGDTRDLKPLGLAAVRVQGNDITPAQGLGHELTHAYNYLYGFDEYQMRMSIDVDEMKDLEEVYVINSFDASFGDYYCSPMRDSYYMSPYISIDATSTIPATSAPDFADSFYSPPTIELPASKTFQINSPEIVTPTEQQ